MISHWPRLGFKVCLFFALVLWLGFIAYPLAKLIRFTLGTHQTFVQIFCDPTIIAVVRFTFFQALLSTLLATLIGFLPGLALGRLLQLNPKSKLQLLFLLPYGIPSLIVGLSWIMWLGRHGILAQLGLHLDWIYRPQAIVLAHLVLNVPWMILMIAQARSRVSAEQIEAAQSLHAGKWDCFYRVTWPQIRWSVGSAMAQVMTLCTTSFALVLVLGGGPPVQTLETALYGYMRYGFSRLSEATACALWEVVFALLPWLAVLTFEKRKNAYLLSDCAYYQSADDDLGAGANQKSFYKRLLLFGIGWLCLAPYLVFLDLRVLRNLTSSGWGGEVLTALFHSLRLALSTSIFTLLYTGLTILGLLALRYRSWFFQCISVLFVLSGGISVLVLGLAYSISYPSIFDALQGTLVIPMILQTALFFPFAFRTLLPLTSGIQIQKLEAAYSLGAGPFRSFYYIEWPRWRGPVVSIFTAVLGASLGEVGAVSLYPPDETVPLSLLISQWARQYHFAEAQGAATVLFVFAMLAMVVSFRSSSRFGS